jgi:hypothetical protein
MRRNLKRVFEDKDWSEGGSHPKSGFGSSLSYTENLRRALPVLFETYQVRSFVDAPCGDWAWMQHVDLGGIDYTGLDISSSLIAANAAAHARDGVSFAVADITSDELPGADLFMCRDCLFHLKFWLRWEFFRNFEASGSKYLLMTSNSVETNRNVAENGAFRKFNPTKPPFNFPEPIETIVETAELNDAGELVMTSPRGGPRTLGLWSRAQVRDVLARYDATLKEAEQEAQVEA